ncbi:MAG TPA: mechanosensitive ion channel domain-containing protein [Thermoanaerobaculia bacterium]|nr:mechanosensitive ion channel domain-containing protein [Thermoanaerobaculia bacterium]
MRPELSRLLLWLVLTAGVPLQALPGPAGTEPGGGAAAAPAGDATATAAPGDGAAAASAQEAPVRFRGQELFRVRSTNPPYTLEDRALAIARRIEEAVAGLPADEVFQVESEDLGEYARVAAGGRVLLVVSPADAVPAGLTPSELGRLWAVAIAEGVREVRAFELRRSIPHAPWLALAASVLLLAAGLVARWLRRRIVAAVDRATGRHLAGIGPGESEHHPARRLHRALLGIVGIAHLAAQVALGLAWLQFVLSLFPPTRPFAFLLRKRSLEPLESLAEVVVGYLPKLAFLAVIVLLTLWALRVLDWLTGLVAARRVTLRSFEPEWAVPTAMLIRVALVALAAIVAFPYLPGTGSPAFQGISIFLGALISFASGGAIANVVAGVMLTYTGSYRVGDWVRLGGELGEVVQKRLLVTDLRTPKNVVVSVPNAVVLAGAVQNYSRLGREGRLVLHTTVGIGYETPWRQVEALLRLAAERTTELLTEPPPFVNQTGLGDFAVTYELNVFTDAPERMTALYTELRRSVLDVFNEYGIQIMTPAYESDPPEPKVVPREQWFAAPARPEIPGLPPRGRS